MLYGHGDDGYRHGTQVRANFSSNVRPGGLSTGLREHLAGCIERVGTYPEAAAETVTARMARAHDLPVERVLVTPGTTAAIHLIAHWLRARRSTILVPTFSEYEDACSLNEHTVSFRPWDDLARGIRPDAADVVWVCNPNNPTGAVLTRDVLLKCVDRCPATRFVVDLAYADFTEEPPVTARDAVAYPNLVLLHSLTKCHAIPGLRVGFVTGAPDTVAALRRMQPPWAVGAVELAAAEFLESSRAQHHGWRAEYLGEARAFRQALAEIDAIEVQPSTTGFFLLHLKRGSAAELKAYLLERHGLLIRNAANFRGLDESWVRISTQRAEENRLLVEALREWTRSG